jgi:hypothetical protein
MCDPLTVAGVAMSAGSMLMNQQAAARVQRAQNDAMEAERIRQRGFDGERDPINTGARQRYENFEGQRQTKSQALGDYFANNVAPATGQSAAPAETPTTVGAGAGNVVVDQQLADAMQRARAYGTQQDQALGNLRAFGDVLGDISVKQGRDAGQIDTINRFSKRSSELLPGELEAAKSKGGSGLFGDILNLGGRVAIGAGLAGVGPSWGGLFGGGGASAYGPGMGYFPGGSGAGMGV